MSDTTGWVRTVYPLLWLCFQLECGAHVHWSLTHCLLVWLVRKGHLSTTLLVGTAATILPRDYTSGKRNSRDACQPSHVDHRACMLLSNQYLPIWAESIKEWGNCITVIIASSENAALGTCLDLTHCLVSVPDPKINSSTDHFQHAGTNISIEYRMLSKVNYTYPLPYSITHSHTPYCLHAIRMLNNIQCVRVVVGCCLATKHLNLNVTQSGGGNNGCGSGLLGVTSTMPQTEQYSPFRLMLFHLENIQVTIIAT